MALLIAILAALLLALPASGQVAVVSHHPDALAYCATAGVTSPRAQIELDTLARGLHALGAWDPTSVWLGGGRFSANLGIAPEFGGAGRGAASISSAGRTDGLAALTTSGQFLALPTPLVLGGGAITIAARQSVDSATAGYNQLIAWQTPTHGPQATWSAFVDGNIYFRWSSDTNGIAVSLGGSTYDGVMLTVTGAAASGGTLKIYRDATLLASGSTEDAPAGSYTGAQNSLDGSFAALLISETELTGTQTHALLRAIAP